MASRPRRVPTALRVAVIAVLVAGAAAAANALLLGQADADRRVGNLSPRLAVPVTPLPTMPRAGPSRTAPARDDVPGHGDAEDEADDD